MVQNIELELDRLVLHLFIVRPLHGHAATGSALLGPRYRGGTPRITRGCDIVQARARAGTTTRVPVSDVPVPA